MNTVAHSLAEAPPPASTVAPINQHQHQQPQPPPSPSPSQPTSVSETAPTPVLPPISSPSAPPVSLPAALAAAAAASAPSHCLPQNPDELPPLRQPSPTSPAHYTFEQHQQQHSHHHLHPVTPPLRKDTCSSISTQATSATLASTETNNTSYSAETSPNLHQSIFSVKDGSDVSNNRRTSRRRTGPLSQQSRERAALIRKLGACNDCRRRRVACHPSHHNMTWEDVVSKFHRSHSPTIQDIAPSLAAAGRPLSPAPAVANVQSLFAHDPQEMDIDSNPPASHQPGRPPLSDARIRTPLPSGPRLEKSLSLPGIESFKNDLQTNVGRMLSTPSRDRYTSVQVLFLFWQDDEDVSAIHSAVRELGEVFDKYYHYGFQVQTIPSSSDGCKSSWRWLSRQLNEFAEDRDERDVLKIVYYAGHTYLDGNREMVLASSRDPERASTIRWGGIQQTLEEARADTLIIMDAAYYPSSRMVRQQGVLELLAASVSEEHFYGLDRCAFTRALAEQLRVRAARLSPLSAAELHANLFSHYAKMVQDKNPEQEVVTSFPSPLHMMMSGNSRLPSIFLSPVYQNSPMRSSFSSYENSPQLHLSIRLDDDNVNLESWNEWLRLMPEGIKDIKVEGPFRATFR
ncbi:hypothetical protein BHE90_013621 [Fusarium euwallaceae]|uniref:Tyrosine-protein phosphatase non-receptor type 6 n=4 Tax=Fusarium solani species complex TaxID=232080 RepID=A0A3M2SAE8_9HYPO|nr:hypothetical protein CDV36_006199 [Fusarium kuroshium]RSL47881.1 hypothetical protein CEP51_015714 [Fusarium floridanum]RSM10589.1 hypothetical protein CDV31_007175 [Fusarium ambrosium]RTE71962.1 hypothetical protein BHE90_013621 [Fusarium euwallaceae]